MLESMSTEEACRIWRYIGERRRNEILREIADDELHELLAEIPVVEENQVNAFELVNGRLRQVAIESPEDLENLQPIWIDLINPTDEERAYIGQRYGLDLPEPDDSTDLEVSSRFQINDNGEIHLRSNFLLDREVNSRSVPVAFILHSNILFSLRYEDLPVFRLQRRRARMRQDYVKRCHDLLVDLYGADVEYSADSLEDIYSTLSRVGRKVLSETMTDQEAASVLADIAEEENLNGQIRSNILDTQRALTFLMQSRLLNQDEINDAREILRNIESLNSHTSFLFDKINFLMDATIGFININQNRRVNQLTVLGVVFMPINVLAGIGGMSEFSMMTEGIPWPIAYGSFIGGMALIGTAIYVLLRRAENRRNRKL